MKLSKFLLVAIFLSSASAFADRITVSGAGTWFGTCNGSNYSWCSDSIKRTAQAEAERNMTYSCNARNGRLAYPTYCGYSFCNPGWMSFNDPDTYVNCRIDCSAPCDY